MSEGIRAELAANVWKVAVAAGDRVADGDVLLVLESMKMEIPVIAESEGTVREVLVHEGDVVGEGDLLITVE